ncbi:CBS domain-containing protein [Planctomycetales bacterium ZRK34]|nr:CBS domain-containing protein [Planctomycetales bacterium ZRK34]
MTTVQEILASKQQNAVTTIDRNVSVLEATQLMNRHKIGALIVEENDRVVGIFTERDVLRRVVAEQHDPATTKVGDVMTDKVVCVTADTSVDDVRQIMKSRRIRHLPVVNGDQSVLAMLSIGDLNAHAIRDGEVTIQYMHEYIYGRV